MQGRQETIIMLGLGHVGLTLALALARVGFRVKGYDINADVRERTKERHPHFEEKDLAEYLDAHVGKEFTIIDELMQEEEPCAYFVTVGTPFNLDNTPNYAYIRLAAIDVGKVIKKGDLVILRSTVPLGTTREVVIPLLEKGSGLRAGADFSVAFAPERTVEGNAFEELKTLPQVIGGFDALSLERTRLIFARLTPTLIELDTLEEAEIVKLINNTYRETVFAFANQVSLLSRAWGLDTKKVIAAANKGYARSQVPFPSPGVGGYCLTKEAYLFRESARKRNVDTRLLSAVRENTSTVLDVLAQEIRDFAAKHFPKRTVTVGVLGFAYKGKPATSDVRGSTTHSLIKRFNYERRDFNFVGFDPLVKPEIIEEMGASPLGSIEAVIAQSDVVVIMNNNPAFEAVAPAHFEGKEACLLLDTWGVCKREDFKNHPVVVYSAL